jgi:twitching motility protein PilT
MESIVALFDKVLIKARDIGASDVHLCTGVPWRYRVHGQVVAIPALPPLKGQEAEAIVRHIITTSNTYLRTDLESSMRVLMDIDCSYSLPGVSRFRVNICRQRGSFSIVLRRIPFDCPSIEDLGLPPVIRHIAHEERGLVLVTGITGSGKSTTLAAMVKEINRTSRLQNRDYRGSYRIFAHRGEGVDHSERGRI